VDVERAGRVGEEAVRVEVRAPQRLAFDDLGDATRAEPQWPPGVPDLALVLAVEHRPLVQPETAELGGPGSGALHEIVYEPCGVEAPLGQRSRAQGDSVRRVDVAAQGEELARRRPG